MVYKCSRCGHMHRKKNDVQVVNEGVVLDLRSFQVMAAALYMCLNRSECSARSCDGGAWNESKLLDLHERRKEIKGEKRRYNKSDRYFNQKRKPRKKKNEQPRTNP